MPVQAAGLSLLLAGMQLGCRNTPNPSTAASTEVYSPGSVESATYQIGNQPIKLSLPVALPDELTRIHANIGNPSSEFVHMFEQRLAGAIYKIQFMTLQIKEGEEPIEKIIQRSGFVITPNGLALTAQHGARNNGTSELGSELELGQEVAMTGATGQNGTGKVIGLIPNLDIAVIQAINYKGQFIPLGNIDTRSIGDMVIIPGFQTDNDSKINGGMSVAFGRYLGGGTKLVSSADEQLLPGMTMGIAAPGLYEPGLSGGPIIGEDGKAYGVAVMVAYNPSKVIYHLLATRVDERFIADR